MTVTETWLRQRYVEDVASVDEIAKEAGCTVANIRRYLKKWAIRRGKVFITGKPAWNSGLTKDDDERLARLAEQRSGEGNPMFGAKAWNAGLSKELDPRLASVAVKLTGRRHDEATLKKMSEAKRGRFGPQANAWKGGTQYANGYGVHRITISGRRVYMHRAIAEEALGRQLQEGEHVHHIDRNKANNGRSNLIVLMEADHTRLHQAISNEGVCTKQDQLNWLNANGIKYEELKDENCQCEAVE